MKTILITGINGFLGSHLAKTLSPDYQIVGLAYSLHNPDRIAGCNIKTYLVEDGISDEIFIEHSFDMIIHTATLYGRRNESYKAIANANLLIPMDLLHKAIINNCRLFINTDTVLDRFVSPYALSKHQFYEWLFIRRDEINVVNMQLEHFYGPGCSKSNFITSMINRLKQNEPTIDLTYGEQQRDFIYIDDVVGAYQMILSNQEKLTGQFTSFEVTTQELISIKDLMIMLKQMTGSSSNLNFGAIPYRENELMLSQTDNSALITLGWRPKYTLSEGLARTLINS